MTPSHPSAGSFSLAGEVGGWVLYFLIPFLLLTSCAEKRHTPSPMFGQPEEIGELEGYDLNDIQAGGELIAVTLSGPDTYYEYRGRGFGLQFAMAEDFARTAGTRLRMEMAPDTIALLERLVSGEADLVALELDSASLRQMLEAQPDTMNALPEDFILLRPHWLVRASSDELAAAINRWWRDDNRQRFLAQEQERLKPAKRIRRHMRPPMLSHQKGIISSYDALFQRYAAAVGWDWRLLAAQCYQESGFDPRAVSWAGAQGLMQIMPATAQHLGLARSDVYEPEPNIAAAARYLRELDATFADIRDRHERISYVLAAYNGGVGHVRDAMALAQKNGRNPHRWTDVDPYILGLAQPRFYRDPVVRYGYLRGSETSGYVRQIHARWASYRGAAHAMTAPIPPPDGARPSRVRPRSEFVITDSVASE